MSSIRPLATITLLACVGVVLYMKINETEQSLPPEMGADWSIPPGVEADLGGLAPSYPPPASTAAPQYGASAVPAPAWSPEPPAGAQQATLPPSGEQSDFEASPTVRSAAAIPELPELPALPADRAGQSATGGTLPAGDYARAGVAAGVVDATARPAATSGSSYAASHQGAASQAISSSPYERAVEPADSSLPEYLSTSEQGRPDQALPTTPYNPYNDPAGAGSSLFATAWLEIQAALDRGELSQALLRLSDWRRDPSLTAAQAREVDELLSQLAGSVIYEGPPAHRLESPYLVQSGESLVEIGQRYNVPWQLLAKINGVTDPNGLQPGQELKVVRGPFSAVIDLSRREMTLMLERRYAGRFDIEIAPDTVLEEGQWKVDQKLLTPSVAGGYGVANGLSEDRSLVLASLTSPTTEPAVIRGPGNSDPASVQPRGRMVRLSSHQLEDVYDILSVGSRVIIRR